MWALPVDLGPLGRRLLDADVRCHERHGHSPVDLPEVLLRLGETLQRVGVSRIPVPARASLRLQS